ncbi:hypothetical protein CPJCM30710_14580 [Clostridium polyendosporum]|uniref:Uncharacterized protein n=1 Tax=Clostridium polyendosporum TaxID=69208 RepID=A0A919RYW7_9CLOT|nr:DUF3006 domain-containing protein [Clostridium polyendosporum]GIM28792.1 hypothetical protein CPJCM30710_14580 [Clostridium polyendosporum]
MDVGGKIYIVDRLEGNVVVCEAEDGKMKNISLEVVKGNPKEGDVLVLRNSTYQIDIEMTLKRKKEIKDLMKGMWDE